MSAHVLLNLLNKLGKKDVKCKLNKFNNTGAQIFNSIYHMTLKLIKNHIFGVRTSRFCHLLRKIKMDIKM